MSILDQNDLLDDREWLERLGTQRLEFIRMAKENNFNLDVFSEGYPDTAHLVYELLQNAEDAEASFAYFDVDSTGLKFEHDGRGFTRDDVDSITTYGNSTKVGDDKKVGHLGLGFKAVYVYTETPHIWSPTLSFKISDKFVPCIISPEPNIGDRTRFWLPFESSKVPPDQAYSEIMERLMTLSANTLLYLSHIQEIGWSISNTQRDTNSSEYRLRRIVHSDIHRQVRSITNGKLIDISNFLFFTEPARAHGAKEIAVVFELKQRSTNRKQQSGDQKSEYSTDLARRFQIDSAKSGNVAIYFTTVKEVSNLRFHLHAPFDPDSFRSSIKDTPNNSYLLEQLSRFAAQSLTKIRDLGLLDRDFLSVLPNSDDVLTDSYMPLRSAIIEEMKKEPLTPKKDGGHAPATTLLQGHPKLKELLSHEDLQLLRDDGDTSYDWAVDLGRDDAANQFLQDLGVEPYSVKEFVMTLLGRCSEQPTLNADKAIFEWMGSKSIEWHRKLYALLHEVYETKPTMLQQLRSLYLVRCSDGKYQKGTGCHFEPSVVNGESEFDYVDKRIYTVDISSDPQVRKEQEQAGRFLKAIGVENLQEKHKLRFILRRYYSGNTEVQWVEHWSHIERFMDWFDSDKHSVRVLKEHLIFFDPSDNLSFAEKLYIDQPYRDTKLHYYYSVTERRAPLSKKYAETLKGRDEEQLGRFVKFALACGTVDKLEIMQVDCSANPKLRGQYSSWDSLRYATHLDEDYVVDNLAFVLGNPTLELAELVWSLLLKGSNETHVLEAIYRKNRNYPTHTVPSQLVCALRDSAWVPQRDQTDIAEVDIQFVKPADAIFERLPTAFSRNPGHLWLEAIEFGKQCEDQLEKQRKTEEMLTAHGIISDEDCLSDDRREAHQAVQDMSESRLREFHEWRRNRNEWVGPPTGGPRDPTRRAKGVREEAQYAPDRTTEARERSVQVHREEVREKARQYLRHLYTDSEGLMKCQLCCDVMPFKLPDGSYYFECAEFIEEFKQEDKFHYQNYLALCPNHEAMFKHANPQKEQMKDKFLGMQDRTMSITLAEKPQAIWFNETHQFDLKTLLEADEQRRQAE